MLAKTAVGGGFLVFSEQEIQRAWSKVPSAALVQGFPTDHLEAKRLSEKLINEYRPSALIAIEARGPNEDGIYHIVNGTDITAYEAKMGTLFLEAKRRNILTIGIIDGCGIEIGFGTISATVEKDYPRYAKCECGCKSGMHDSTHVDIVLPAAVSNWGANGIAACLAALLEKKDILHNALTETRMIRICANAGAMDGTTGRAELGVDGLQEGIHAAIVEMLGEIVQCAFKGYATELKSY
jgi:hypothetical protein